MSSAISRPVRLQRARRDRLVLGDRLLRLARAIWPAHTTFFSAVGGSPLFVLGDMTIQRMDNVAIVVDNLAAVAFFTDLVHGGGR